MDCKGKKAYAYIAACIACIIVLLIFAGNMAGQPEVFLFGNVQSLDVSDGGTGKTIKLEEEEYAKILSILSCIEVRRIEEPIFKPEWEYTLHLNDFVDIKVGDDIFFIKIGKREDGDLLRLMECDTVALDYECSGYYRISADDSRNFKQGIKRVLGEHELSQK